MNVKSYIESGILETYVLGLASEAEVQELLRYKEEYPEVLQALTGLETDMERLAGSMAVTPPPRIWQRIEKDIEEIARIPETKIVKTGNGQNNHTSNGTNGQQFIEVEGQSSHIRVHRAWRWVFAAVFILGKIFLICAIYFYLENRQAQEQIQQLKTELKHFKTAP